MVQYSSSLNLASDPDREGEAISWHLMDEFGLSNYKRVVFNEITKPALLEAFEHPRDIDMDLVKSQETRNLASYRIDIETFRQRSDDRIGIYFSRYFDIFTQIFSKITGNEKNAR